MGAVCVMLPLKARRLSVPPALLVIDALTRMSVVACSDSWLLLLHEIGSTTLMRPVPAPPLLVVTVTEAPPSADDSDPVDRNESSTVPVAWNVVGPLVFALESVPLMPAT